MRAPAHVPSRVPYVRLQPPSRAAEATDRRGRVYCVSMTGRIGAKGQVVIPKSIRDRANLHPGDEVDFELREEQIVLVARRSPSALGGRYVRSGMAARLLEERGREPR